MASDLRKIRVLERRRDHLAKRVAEQLREEARSGRQPLGYDLLELEALEWAIERLTIAVHLDEALDKIN